MSLRATLRCLTGCAVGEVAGLAIGTALGWGTGATMALAIALAFLFGYGLTGFGLVRGGMDLRAAAAVALAADTVSIAVMEVADNGVMLLVPGAMGAGLGDGLFWAALAVALAVAFAAAVPVNRWLIARGRGHAAAHRHHGPHPA
jgi:hypothetical protein